MCGVGLQVGVDAVGVIDGELAECLFPVSRDWPSMSRRVKASNGRISAERLLPIAATASYQSSARNFRRLAAEQKSVVAQHS